MEICVKILNLFAGIGGNRTLWGTMHDITAVENIPRIAGIYADRFPDDTIIIGDAYDYFLDNFEKFDIVWASPPCITHTRLVSSNIGHRYHDKKYKAKLPDLRLYSLILFLQHQFRGNWVVENVQGMYYKPLVHPTSIIGRHWIWSNVVIPSLKKTESVHIAHGGDPEDRVEKASKVKGLSKYEVESYGISDQMINNCVLPKEGKYVLDHLISKQKSKRIWDYYKI